MADAPPEKKQRTEEPQDAEMKTAEETPQDEKKEIEPPKELEEDAPVEMAKQRIKEEVEFLVADTTMNVMPSTCGNLLMSLTDGGIQHLFAGARANVGIKSGRYMFETKIVENINPTEDHQSHTRAPKPKHVLRVGFSTAKSSLIMREAEEEAVYFDSEGGFVQSKKREWTGKAFTRDEVVAVLLNLDEKSPNCNTVSLFKDGMRASQPQPLPDALKGQALFPTISWKCLSVHVNFGKEPLAPLPFKCRMVKDASIKDATVTSYPVAKDGKNEVAVPVCLPDEGTFEWLKMFHEKNPGYTELSDRMILDWAEKSDISRQKGFEAKTSSNDKPEMNFGIKELDDNSVRRILQAIAPLQPRNFVCMEVLGNLIKDERKALLARFSSPMFKKTGYVVVGEPNSEFKKRTNEVLLKQKQEASDAEFKAKKAEEKKKKLEEKQKRQIERIQKKAEKEKNKAAREQAKKLMAEKKAAEEAAKKEEGKDVPKEDKKEEDEPKDGEKEKEEDKPKAEEKEEEEKDEEEEEEEKDDEEMDEEPPTVQLTQEEKKIWFAKPSVPDLTPYSLSKSLASFSIPDKAEGFTELKFEWVKAAKAQEYLKEWVSDKKLTTRVEDLTPSDWFTAKWSAWQKLLQTWHAKHNEHKAAVAKKEAAKAAKKDAALKKAAAAKDASAKKKAEEDAAKEAGKEEGAEKADEGAEAKAAEEPVPMDEDTKEEEEAEEEDKTVDFDSLDVFSVDSALDIGGGEPIFKEFQFEDWTVMSLRFELHLLAHAFRHDVEDPERAGIHLDHLAFYYNKYYKKALSTKYYGVETFNELIDLVNDTVYATKKQVLESQLDAEMESLEIFTKLTEEARRYRNLRIALGEDSAKLKLSQPALNPGQQNQAYRGGGKRSGKSWGAKGWHNDKGEKGDKGGKGKSYTPATYQHYNPPSWHQPAPRFVAPRTVRPPDRQAWQADQAKGK